LLSISCDIWGYCKIANICHKQSCLWQQQMVKSHNTSKNPVVRLAFYLWVIHIIGSTRSYQLIWIWCLKVILLVRLMNGNKEFTKCIKVHVYIAGTDACYCGCMFVYIIFLTKVYYFAIHFLAKFQYLPVRTDQFNSTINVYSLAWVAVKCVLSWLIVAQKGVLESIEHFHGEICCELTISIFLVNIGGDRHLLPVCVCVSPSSASCEKQLTYHHWN
jgi:hypothetical protein